MFRVIGDSEKKPDNICSNCIEFGNECTHDEVAKVSPIACDQTPSPNHPTETIPNESVHKQSRKSSSRDDQGPRNRTFPLPYFMYTPLNRIRPSSFAPTMTTSPPVPPMPPLPARNPTAQSHRASLPSTILPTRPAPPPSAQTTSSTKPSSQEWNVFPHK